MHIYSHLNAISSGLHDLAEFVWPAVAPSEPKWQSMGGFEKFDFVHFVFRAILGFTIFIQAVGGFWVVVESSGRSIVASSWVQLNDESINAIIWPFSISTLQEGLRQDNGRHDWQKCRSLEFLLGQFGLKCLGPKLCRTECLGILYIVRRASNLNGQLAVFALGKLV